MITYLDSTALLGAVCSSPQRPVAIAAIDDAETLAACDLALTEATAAIDRLVSEPAIRSDIEDELYRLWDHLHTVPVDQAVLDDASELARAHPIRVSDAIHLVAARRLSPRPRFVTFEARQIAAAEALGFEVVSTR